VPGMPHHGARNASRPLSVSVNDRPRADWRRRAAFAAAAVATIGVGLAVHERGIALGPVGRDVFGDALWAAMMLWLVSVGAPHARVIVRSATAYLICAGVEVSQLYHVAALDAARATTLGGLVLGTGFDWRDLGAYAVGVACAALLEATVAGRLARVRADR
jgi:hypothetical protein